MHKRCGRVGIYPKKNEIGVRRTKTMRICPSADEIPSDLPFSIEVGATHALFFDLSKVTFPQKRRKLRGE
jgi:hypothetical protein